MRRLTLFSTIILATAAIQLSAQVHHPTRYKHLARNMRAEWYASDEARTVADSTLKYQFPSGGWAKNHDWHLPAEGSKLQERQEVWQQIHSESGVGSTIDNGATTTEMLLLAKVYAAQPQKKYRKAFIQGLNYLLEAQYDNGGWPQYYPFKPYNNEGHPFYSNHITFNDDAIYNVMLLLRAVYNDEKPFAALKLSDNDKERARQAFDRGIACILNCQIRKNGQLTVWCQQHDEKTLAPANARAYELASFTGSHETVSLLHLLMSLPQPDERVITSVTAAVEWLKAHVIKDMAIEGFINAEGKRDRRLVHRFGSNTWARYYDLETEEPYVCDRDGKPQPAMEYIGYERRNGYGWYGNQPQEIIDAYPAWMEKHGHSSK